MTDDDAWATTDLSDDHPDWDVALPGLVHHGGRRRFCGPIRTVVAPQDNTLVRKAVEEPGDGAVLVVDGGGAAQCALVGGNLGQLAHTNGWAGIVVHGYVRDVTELAALDLGVLALGAMPRKSEKAGRGNRDQPVKFLGAAFTPGGWLWADPDGVVVAPPR